MREIKFRGIGKTGVFKNKVLYGYYFKRLDGTEWITTINDDSTYGDCEIIKGTGSQYTGLKDKNGKEIYEGDIFFEEKPHVVEWFIGTLDEDEFANAYTGYILRDINAKNETGMLAGIFEFSSLEYKRSFSNYGYGGIETYDCEIIGNIHENPELLEENKK
jgi:uncharacterized phage protein (TIGR01671 family)